jgi:hypothetical protein
MPALRDASELLWPAVQETIASLGLLGSDAAAVKLAQRYAQVIDQAADQAWAMRWLAPLLLDALTELGATPAARARLTKGAKAPDGKPNRLAQLRAARGA